MANGDDGADEAATMADGGGDEGLEEGEEAAA